MLSISRKKLAHSVIEEIKGMIERGELDPGDKLPNQNEFAAQLGVSRTVLREALQTLNQLGVIEQRPKYGTVIRAKTPFLYSEHLIPPLMSDNLATIELIQARKCIEIEAAELAARYASAAQIKEMEKIVDEMLQMCESGDDSGYAEKNIVFHFLIAKASHNRFMVHLLATIRGYMEQWTQESITVLPGLLDRSLKSHREIYEAIRDRDHQKAANAMRKHLMDFQKSLEKYYKLAVRSNASGAR